MTHLAGVAAHAHRHLLVTKEMRGGRTHTNIAALDGEARVPELAAMMGAIRAARWRSPTRASSSTVLSRRCARRGAQAREEPAMTADYPLLFERRLLEKVWGARRLEGRFGIALPAGKAIGESWGLSDHPSGESAVRNGALAGRTLRLSHGGGPARDRWECAARGGGGFRCS